MYSQVTPPPVTSYAASPSPQNTLQNSSLRASGVDPRSHALAEALAGLRDQAKNIRTPVALGADLLAEALLQRRYGPSSSPSGGSVAEGGARVPPSGGYAAPEGGDLAPAPAPQTLPAPSPSPGVPAPGGTASAAPAASSPAAGAAVAPLAPEGLALRATPLPSPPPTLVDALKAYVLGALAPAGKASEQAQDPGSP